VVVVEVVLVVDVVLVEVVDVVVDTGQQQHTSSSQHNSVPIIVSSSHVFGQLVNIVVDVVVVDVVVVEVYVTVIEPEHILSLVFVSEYAFTDTVPSDVRPWATLNDLEPFPAVASLPIRVQKPPRCRYNKVFETVLSLSLAETITSNVSSTRSPLFG